MSILRCALLPILGIMLVLVGISPTAAQESIVRRVTVIGRGEASARPDTAHVSIGVQTEAPTAQEALAQNNEQMTAIIARLRELGIADPDIQTSNFSIYPRHDNETSNVIGYVVSHSVTVTIRNLDQAGMLLDQVVQLGANRINGISFSVDNPEAYFDIARANAMTDARRKAEQLASLAGAQLGPVLIIDETSSGSPPLRSPVPETAPVADVPIEPGEQQFRVQIQVTFELQ